MKHKPPKHDLSDVTDWVFNQALPLWCKVGQDKPGLGFFEQIALDGTALDPGFKRMRVQARQVYVFCHAAELGWNGPAVEAARNGIEFILKYGWLPEGGWAFKLGSDGEQIDDSMHAYEQAFVMYALGWYYKLTRDSAILDQIHRTLDVMHERLDHPGGLGFLTQAIGALHMEQDPHMHFLEAMLLIYGVTDDRRFADEATRILHLFSEQMLQPSGVLLENYDLDWRSPTDPGQRIVEPGHHFEWIWLLRMAKNILNKDLTGFIPTIFDFADRFGADIDGLVYDDVYETGKVLNPTHRTWVQTEALKGYIVMDELYDDDQSVRILQLKNILMHRYLNTKIPGLWTDQPTSVSKANVAPASTFYHLFLAFAELQRWARSVA
jgi:N-acylglucosamine 2-epimerase/mannose-6-phosphate isomerase